MKNHDFGIKLILRLGERFKPIAVKILPRSFLKKIKARAIRSITLRKYQPFDPKCSLFGINLIGFIKAEMGLGESCRILADGIQEAKIPFSIWETRVGNPFHHGDCRWEAKISKSLFYGIDLIHVNPEQLPQLFGELPSFGLNGKYRIGYWLWELEDFPREWEQSFSLLDEIWVPTEFCRQAIQKCSPKRVYKIPYGFSFQTTEKSPKSKWGIPEDSFLFLTMFDANSTIERKNPIGAIKAFQSAFSPKDNTVSLAVKVSNCAPEILKKLQQAAAGYENIYILKGTLPKAQVQSLIASSDCLVSLHRAEGFGLVLAEAMAAGVPVIATGWSANTEFMNEENSCPVSFSLTEIQTSIGCYQKGQRWAEPNLFHAAEYMKRLRSDPVYYKRLQEAGKRTIRESFSLKNAAGQIRRRIESIYEEQEASNSG